MTAATSAPFGTVFTPTMPMARFGPDGWQAPEMIAVDSIALSPAAHALHYGSTCFEGLKAHKGVDGVVRMFRPDKHIARLRQSAGLLHLAKPDADVAMQMLTDLVHSSLEHVPSAPGSLYLRPVLLGTEPNIGAAATPSKYGIFYILASPVGDYFAGGIRPLKLLVETETPRTTPQFGMVKSGANYVMALGITLDAKAKFGVDQILFAPGGQVQETGAANFLMFDEGRVVTRALDSSFLHGVTRDSVLTIAKDLGLEVEERPVTTEELFAWAERGGEMALSGTAAVLSGVGTLVHHGVEHVVGDGEVGPITLRLRERLTQIQTGVAPDDHGWTVAVTA